MIIRNFDNFDETEKIEKNTIYLLGNGNSYWDEILKEFENKDFLVLDSNFDSGDFSIKILNSYLQFLEMADTVIIDFELPNMIQVMCLSAIQSNISKYKNIIIYSIDTHSIEPYYFAKQFTNKKDLIDYVRNIQ